MAKKVGSVYTEIRARLDKYERDLAKAQGKTTKAAGRMQRSYNKLNFDRATKSLTKFIGAFAGLAGLKAFSNFLADSVALNAEWERRLLRTEALLISTGGAAGYTADQLAKFAREIDLATMFDKKGVLDAINVMQTFRSIQGETFKQAIRLSTDLAEINQTSVRASAMQLAKILEAPDRLLSSLTRSGIIFSKSQETLIKNLVKSNRLLDAQQIILKKLSDEIGGAAAGAAGGLAGKIDEMSYRWVEFKEALTNTETASRGVKAIADSLDFITEKLKSGEAKDLAKSFFATFTPLGRGLAGFEILKKAWRDYWQFFRDLESGNLGKRKNVFVSKVGQQPDDMTAHVKAYEKELKRLESLKDSGAEVLDTDKVLRERAELQSRAWIQHKELMEQQSRDYIEMSNAEIAKEKELQEKSIEEKRLLWEREAELRAEAVRRAAEKKAQEEEKSFLKSIELSRRTASAMQQNFSSLFYDVIKGELRTFSDYFNAFANSLLRAWSDLMGQMATEWIFGDIAKIGGGGGLLGTIGDFFSPAAGTTTIRGGQGGGYGFNSGGYIGEGVIGRGKQTGKSYEFHPNEFVIPAGKMGGGSSGVNVTVNNYGNDKVNVDQQQNPGGMREIFITVGENILNHGPVGQAIESTYGLRRPGRSI